MSFMREISKNTMNGSLMTSISQKNYMREADYIFRKVNDDFYKSECSYLATKDFYCPKEVLSLLNGSRKVLIIGEINWISNF